jgi:hypothetical protein
MKKVMDVVPLEAILNKCFYFPTIGNRNAAEGQRSVARSTLWSVLNMQCAYGLSSAFHVRILAVEFGTVTDRIASLG